MNNISVNKDNCFGCGVCVKSCSRNAIEMSTNKDGFYYPKLDNRKCVDCGLCLKTCPKQNVNYTDVSQIKGYAVWSKDNNIRKECSSGGVSYELLKKSLSLGFKTIACKYNVEKSRAEHYISDSIVNLEYSKGSKYIQSWTEDVLRKICLTDKYLVVGSPCQIAGFRNWTRLKKIEDNYLFIDFFCHGVPSANLWLKYLDEIRVNSGKINGVKWRDKTDGWHQPFIIKIDSMNGELSSKYRDGDLFYKFFFANNCHSRSCYKDCKFKGVSSSADIRVGDLWGSKYENNSEGVSGVIIYTSKGKHLFDLCRDSFDVVEENIEVVTEGQMFNNSQMPYYYSFLMYLLRSGLSLKVIYRITQCLRIHEILCYKLHLKK